MVKFAGTFLGMPKCVGIFVGLKSGLRPSPCSRQKTEYPSPPPPHIGAVARSDARPPGMLTLAGAILTSGKTFFR